MYNDKTTVALKVIIKFCYVGLALALVFLYLLQYLGAHGTTWIYGVEMKYYIVLYSFALSMPAGYVALAFIDKLLTVVRQDEVFGEKTIKYLDIISICCLCAAAVGIGSVVASAVLHIDTYVVMFFMIAMGELFMALLLKVVKKVFSKAIELKEENDLTV
ncbi:DUF2975 domain-containing protein [Eubacterium sp.]|uniref:DUF2975 domain-containing protein n=1 Tax=Eubacterium sp. TaxID=142586 RepID=UPI0025BB0427|nr:DUF2975 domain-containing protein [Eubacterium sp.]MCI7801182.1 DUF2975 domain-containing protein [Eubacterium sp.]